ncbi:hypothetical protein [Streptacidiphilus rugosus]|uniref:hypothetical protein n=1 Tax=Streptacidiphilus rugosus TaxID=405783 RepID=UPI00068AEB64|nr:hypothetical protein [Streptacidiphilus rugosus]
MANSYRTATRAAVHRANAYYFGPDHVLSAGSRRLDLGMAVAVLRAVLSVLLVAGLLVLVLFTDLRLFGGRWPTLALVMVCTPFAVGAWWHLRRRRRAEAESEAESEAGSAAGSECETETESPPAG